MTTSADATLSSATVVSSRNSSYALGSEEPTESDTSTGRMGDVVTTVVPSLKEATYIENEITDFIRKYYQLAISVFGILGNFLALAVLAQRKMRVKTTYMYMLALSVTDVAVLTISILWWTGRYVNINSVWFCKLHLFLFYLAIHTSVWLLVSMTIERYLAVTFPLKAKAWITRRRAVLTMSTVFILTLTLNLHNLWTRTMITFPSGKTLCLFSNVADRSSRYGYFHLKVWPWIDAFTYSFLPLLMLSILNILIIRNLRNASMQRQKALCRPNEHPATGTATEATKAGTGSTERQVTTMLLSVTSAFILLTGPMAVFLIVEKIWTHETNAHETAIHGLVRSVTANLMFTNHATNFLLYCATGRAFRSQLKALMCYPRARGAPNIRNIAVIGAPTLVATSSV